ncbi:hypothetical protein O6H91_10G040400 [Diphasiastrum complanatum]|uniref:Uncharacterized protein n=1 Tax=Diphasiastrum complanatum TaxID=34168 RepID=A0ACC2CGC7_DIPCM|nr:hypothetical protein O6H91_Y106200 [Diphasiastrum complanatum]KAJ7541000.1 hypothetical protein O6H91_10G040400 [Diphasiastrum complanatum]
MSIESSSDDQYGELLAWGASMGITDAPLSEQKTHGAGQIGLSSLCLGHCLCIASFPAAGGRGLAAMRDLSEGELILRVPGQALMSSKTARQDPRLKKILDSFPALSSSQILTIHLLSEIAKGSTSQWYAYLVHLPRVHHTLSYFCSFEAEELQEDDAICTAKSAAQKAYADWEAARPVILKMGLSHRFATLKAWLWAAATVSSRSLHVPWDEAGALCPIGDFFNYAPPGQHEANVVSDSPHSSEKEQQLDDEQSGFGLSMRERLRDGGYDTNLGAYCFYARQQYKKGQQVLLCYGQYNDLELLEYYGFLLPHNPNNMVYLLPPDPLEFGHSNLGASSQHLACRTRFHLMANGNPSFSLLAAMRLSAASPALRKSHGYHALSGQQLSIEVDNDVYRWLSEKCQKLLAKFPTISQEDIVLVKILSACCDSNGSQTVSAFLNELSKGRKPFPDFIDKDLLTYSPTVLENVIKQLLQMMKVEGFKKGFSDHTKIAYAFERWKAAIQWRLSHKAVLERCIQYSNRKLLLLNKELLDR